MLHLTPADYRTMPWANGRGQTVELFREDRDGGLLYRLSMALVTEDGPFSLLPGIERVLTVISGPGFDLEGEGLHLEARPLMPVAFAGDIPIRATGVTAPSEDFNVMTARSLPLPEVRVVRDCHLPEGGLLGVFALGPLTVNGSRLALHDLALTRGDARVKGGADAIAVRIFET